MRLFIENQSGQDISGFEGIIRRAAAEALREEKVRFNAEISVVVASSDEIRRLNKRHRGIDKATDCLSFPLLETMPKTRGPRQTRELVTLGDVVICLDEARRQAAEFGHGIEREIGFLTAHSVLHLLGHDHQTESGERVMIEKQKRVMANIGLGDV